MPGGGAETVTIFERVLEIYMLIKVFLEEGRDEK